LRKEYEIFTLLIRKCYVDLQEIIFDDKINKLHIVENLNIGKNFFRYYLLYLLAQKNKTIIYDNFNEIDLVIFEEEKSTFTNDNDAIKLYLRNLAIWYIADSH